MYVVTMTTVWVVTSEWDISWWWGHELEVSERGYSLSTTDLNPFNLVRLVRLVTLVALKKPHQLSVSACGTHAAADPKPQFRAEVLYPASRVNYFQLRSQLVLQLVVMIGVN